MTTTQSPSPSVSSTPPLTRDIGEAERALRALLERQLAPARLSFPAWTVLVFLESAAPQTQAALVQRQLDGHVAPTRAAAQATIDHLFAAGLLTFADVSAASTPGGGPVAAELRPLVRTPAGDAVFRPVRDAVARVTRSLFGDLPVNDLEATRRTLGEVARRAHALLAADGAAAAPGSAERVAEQVA